MMMDTTLTKLYLVSIVLGTASAVVPVTGPPLELTSEIINDSVYHEQVVTFRCVTRGSTILAWSSNDYIGSGLLVELLTIDIEGETRTYNNGTIATLTYKHVDGSFVLESTLRIQASRMYPTSTVSCQNVNQGLKDNITFHVLATPAQEVSSSLQRPYACLGDRINFTCTTHSSTILAWQSRGYIGDGTQLEFLSIHQPGKSLQSAINPNTSAQLVSVSMENEKIDIVSTLSIVVLENLGGVHMTCINVGIGTRETIYFPVGGEDCNQPDSRSTTLVLPSAEEARPSDEGLRIDIIVGVILGIAALISVIIILIVIAVLVHKRDRAIRTELDIERGRRMFSAELPQEIRHQWRRFGRKAEVEEKVLDKIGKTSSSKDGRLSLVLDHWIRSSKEERTWTDVVEVLKSMGQHQLAREIELKKTNSKEFQLQETVKNFSAQLQRPLNHNDKWRNFGEAVEIQENVLDDIAAKDHRVSRMLEYWLRRETEEPTWNDVAEVLKKIECLQAARDIERIFIRNEEQKMPATPQAKPDEQANSQAKPESTATPQAKPDEQANSQAKPESTATSQAKPEEQTTSQV